MGDERELLGKRFIELARRAENGGYFTFTDFLGLAEQSIFDGIRTRLGRTAYVAFGGAEGAERVMIRFGNEEELGYAQPFPIRCLRIRPKAEKFAEKLSHRDFLGALMSLGIEREVLGDIVIRDSIGYLFLREDMLDFVAGSLSEIRRTTVVCEEVCELPEGELYRTEERRIQLSSERLDAVIAKTFNLSREDAQALFARGLVFASGREIASPSYTPKVGEKVSVRGHGRLIYRGVDGLSRKGKLNVTISLYV